MHKAILLISLILLASCGGSSGGTSSPTSAILGLALDSLSTPTKVYVANSDNHTIQALDISTNVVTILAGLGGTSGSADATGTSARFYEPYALANLGGNLYVADTANYTIRKITFAGVATTLAGTAGAYGMTDGVGASASFNVIKGITGYSTFLYVTDTYEQTIRKVDINSGAVTTFAGYPGVPGTTDGIGSASRFNYPFGITTFDGSKLFVTDTANQTIRVIDTSTKNVTTLAGTAGTSGALDATGVSAKFNGPAGIATDGTYLFVADSANHTIRKIDISSGVVTTLAGTAGVAGNSDGSGSAAKFNTPIGLVIDNAGNLYVSDQLYSKIRKITSSGVVSTISATF